MNKRIALARLATLGWVLVALGLFWNGWFFVPYFTLGFIYLIKIEVKQERFFDNLSIITIGWLIIVTTMITVFWDEKYRRMPVKQFLGGE